MVRPYTRRMPPGSWEIPVTATMRFFANLRSRKTSPAGVSFVSCLKCVRQSHSLDYFLCRLQKKIGGIHPYLMNNSSCPDARIISPVLYMLREHRDPLLPGISLNRFPGISPAACADGMDGLVAFSAWAQHLHPSNPTDKCNVNYLHLFSWLATQVGFTDVASRPAPNSST